MLCEGGESGESNNDGDKVYKGSMELVLVSLFNS